MDGHNQKLVPDQILKDLFPPDNELDEESLHIAKGKKISNWGIGQDRVIILSTHHIFLLSTKEIRKKVHISALVYIIKSLSSNEVLLYFNQGFDMRLVFDSREDFLNLVKLRFASFMPQKTLKVYGVPFNSLKEFKTAASRQKGYAFDSAPEDKYRLYDEEIPGQEDRVSTVKKGGV